MSSVKRTQVIDDESDYFSADSNRWLNQKEKEALKKREDELRSIRFASRKDRKITLDFAGRRVIEEDPNIDVYNADDEVVQSVNFSVDTSHEKVDPGNFSVINPDSSMQPEVGNMLYSVNSKCQQKILRILKILTTFSNDYYLKFSSFRTQSRRETIDLYRESRHTNRIKLSEFRMPNYNRCRMKE